MEKKRMIEIRNTFYKAALIGFIFMFAGLAFFWLFPAFIAYIWLGVFGANAAAFPFVAFLSFALFELFIITFFLIPALALHWQYRGK